MYFVLDRRRYLLDPDGYLLGSYRTATAPDLNSRRLTSFSARIPRAVRLVITRPRAAPALSVRVEEAFGEHGERWRT